METVQHIDHQAVQSIRHHLDHQGQKIGLVHQRRGLDQGQKEHEERDGGQDDKKGGLGRIDGHFVFGIFFKEPSAFQ